MNDGYQHEALDRCHVIICTIEEHLHGHPFVQRNKDVEKLVGQAVRSLSYAYQLIGSKESEGSMSKELIANLRGENLDCICAAWSRSECACSTNWPESFCKEAADALEAAERKLEIAREALQKCVDMPKSHEAHRVSVQALAQLGEPCQD